VVDLVLEYASQVVVGPHPLRFSACILAPHHDHRVPGHVADVTGNRRGRTCRRRSVRIAIHRPGISGARTFCGYVGLPARLVVLPAKDLREWVKNGATRQAVEACLAAHTWRA